LFGHFWHSAFSFQQLIYKINYLIQNRQFSDLAALRETNTDSAFFKSRNPEGLGRLPNPMVRGVFGGAFIDVGI